MYTTRDAGALVGQGEEQESKGTYEQRRPEHAPSPGSLYTTLLNISPAKGTTFNMLTADPHPKYSQEPPSDVSNVLRISFASKYSMLRAFKVA